MAKLRLHERTLHVQKVMAKATISYFKDTPDLTAGEHMLVLANILSSVAKYEIRDERHSNDDKPGDLE